MNPKDLSAHEKAELVALIEEHLAVSKTWCALLGGIDGGHERQIARLCDHYQGDPVSGFREHHLQTRIEWDIDRILCDERHETEA